MTTRSMTTDEITAWFQGRIAGDWFEQPVAVQVDRDEVLVTGTLAVPALASDASEEARGVACSARIEAFRTETRDRRVRIAREAEHRFQRKVSWGARCGEVEELFTVANVPVMTRLRMPERGVLDTLIDAGIARSRSDALAWCVRLVGRNQREWIDQLREAMAGVERVRAQGPTLG